MAQIKVEIKNLAAIKSAFAKSPAIMTKNLNIAIKRSIFQIQRKAIPITPKDTGNLQNSLARGTKFSNLKGSLFSNLNYAGFVHDGTRYMKGRPYLKKGAENAQPLIDQEFEDAVKNTLNEIARAT